MFTCSLFYSYRIVFTVIIIIIAVVARRYHHHHRRHHRRRAWSIACYLAHQLGTYVSLSLWVVLLTCHVAVIIICLTFSSALIFHSDHLPPWSRRSSFHATSPPWSSVYASSPLISHPRLPILSSTLSSVGPKILNWNQTNVIVIISLVQSWKWSSRASLSLAMPSSVLSGVHGQSLGGRCRYRFCWDSNHEKRRGCMEIDV